MVASPEERGRALRKRVPRSSIARWKPPRGRDATGVLVNQERALITSLLPLRHHRMSASPFAFYRGSAAVMAADLVGLPATGLRVQVCGDAQAPLDRGRDESCFSFGARRNRGVPCAPAGLRRSAPNPLPAPRWNVFDREPLPKMVRG